MGVGKQGQLGRINERKSDRQSCRDSKGISPEWTVGKRTTTQFLSSILVPQAVPLRKCKRAVAVAAGTWSTFVVGEDGTPWAFGLNNCRQLALDEKPGRAQCVFAPARMSRLIDSHHKKKGASSSSDSSCVAGRGGVRSIDAGQHHVIAAMTDGSVVALGRGDCGRLGQGDEAHHDTPVAVPGVTAASKVVAGASVSYAISAPSGAAYGWGFGENLQLTTGSEDDCLSPVRLTGRQLESRKVLDVSVGGQHILILATDE